MSTISKLLKTIIEKEKISHRALARAIGLDHASLSRSLRDDGNPESRTIEKILNHLGYDLEVVKKRRGK
jgi:DNA-binding phage protein